MYFKKIAHCKGPCAIYDDLVMVNNGRFLEYINITSSSRIYVFNINRAFKSCAVTKAI